MSTDRSRAIPGPLTTPALARSPLSRVCPKCEADVGMSCRRWIAARVCGKETGGGYWRRLTNFHRERKGSKSKKEQT